MIIIIIKDYNSIVKKKTTKPQIFKTFPSPGGLP